MSFEFLEILHGVDINAAIKPEHMLKKLKIKLFCLNQNLKYLCWGIYQNFKNGIKKIDFFSLIFQDFEYLI